MKAKTIKMFQAIMIDGEPGVLHVQVKTADEIKVMAASNAKKAVVATETDRGILFERNGNKTLTTWNNIQYIEYHEETSKPAASTKTK